MKHKYCIHCGRQIKANSVFCPYCGAKQIISNDQNSINNNQFDNIDSNNNLNTQSNYQSESNYSPRSSNITRKPRSSRPKTIRNVIIGIVLVIVAVIAMGIHINNQYIHPINDFATKSMSHKWDISMKEIDNNGKFVYDFTGHVRFPNITTLDGKEIDSDTHQTSKVKDSYGYDKKHGDLILQDIRPHSKGDKLLLHCYKYKHGSYYFHIIGTNGQTLDKQRQDGFIMIFKEGSFT